MQGPEVADQARDKAENNNSGTSASENSRGRGTGGRLTNWPSDCMVNQAMKVEIPAMAFVRGFKVDHEPIIRFKDDWRPVWLIVAEFQRSLARPWKPRRPVDLVLDTSDRVRK